jgi:DNA polymerase elongation subunit (family B)
MNTLFENPADCLFLDIETVPLAYDLQDLPKPLIEEWTKIHNRRMEKDEEWNVALEESYFKFAALFPEFAKLCTIGLGKEMQDENGPYLYARSISNDDDSQLADEDFILRSFIDTVLKRFSERSKNENDFKAFVGHNIFNFDWKFIIRRAIIKGFKLPKVMLAHNRKPWQQPYILDTMEMWKMGGFDNVNIATLAAVLNVETPKDDIDGSSVAKCYYEDKDLDRIRNYCTKDVQTLYEVYRKMTQYDFE